MRKILCVLLCVLMLASALVACGSDKQDPLQLGLGVYTAVKTTDAGEANGSGQVTATVAAVLVDAEGKIVKCVIDCSDNKVAFTAEGKAVAATEFKTKYEKKDEYGMRGRSSIGKEWFEQADAFAALCVGKTAAEVLALVVDGDKGTDEVITAGCTITVNEMALAVKKAVKNAKASSATAADTLKLGVVSALTSTDATEEKAGQQKLVTDFAAVVLTAEGKIAAVATDCLQATFKFDAKGVATPLTEQKTKRELGDDYGMRGRSSIGKEWFEQADAFESVVVGKTLAEVAALITESLKGNDAVINAGCTITIEGFTGAIAKVG